MDRQEVFNTVYKHLLTQRKTAQKASTGRCLYRTHDGLRCAVGCLLTDDEARRLDDVTGTVTELYEEGALPDRLVPVLTLLQELQSVHDTYPVEFWESHLMRVARTYELSVPEVSNG